MKTRSLRRRIAAAATTAVTLAALTACGATTDGTSTTAGTSLAAATVSSIDATHADSDDGEYDAAEATTVTLADGASTVDGSGASVDGDVVTITEPGTYELSGSLSDGQVVVDSSAEGKVKLVLDGVDITSSSTSPLVIGQADEAVVILAEGSTNTLSDAAASGADDETEDAPTATLFSLADLTIAGTGSLTVAGESNDGIASKDGLVILSGDITVTATDDGIRGKDYLVIEDGTIAVTAGGDGLKADNESTETSSGNENELGWFQLDGGTVTIDAGSDGVDAVGALNVADGALTVTGSLEGLEGKQITVAGGTVDVTATEDGINATTTKTDTEDADDAAGARQQGPGGGDMSVQDGVLVTISGGDVHVDSGADGIDTNGNATITGGTVLIDSGARGGGDGSLDANGEIDVSGGTLVATGGLSTAPATTSGQGWIATSLSTTASPGQQVVVADGDGNVVASYVVNRDSSAVVVSSEAITSGESYTVYVGDAGDASGYSADGSTDGLTEAATVTAGEYAGGQGPGGGGGGGFSGQRP